MNDVHGSDHSSSVLHSNPHLPSQKPPNPREDTDNRSLFDPKSNYSPEYIRDQCVEARYIFTLLGLSLLALACIGLGFIDRALSWTGVEKEILAQARRYEWLSAGGLLGGTVYAAKWLYHAIAKGLWHEDRRTWRYLSPWISLGTTVGIGALIEAGFFSSKMEPSGSAAIVGTGFLIGYLADRFLAKMKELTQVLFGETESHFKQSRDSDKTKSHDP